MLDSVLALIPTFLLIALGFAMKRGRFVPDAFWAPAEKTTYYITFPALLLASTARAPLADMAWGPLMAVNAGAILVVFTVMTLARPLFKVGPAAFTSMIQGSIRPNTYLGLAAAASLYGEAGVALTAICIASVVPLVNMLAVATLVRCVGTDGTASRRQRLGQTARGIVTNPLILACLLGMALNGLGIGMPEIVIGPFLDILGSAALPLGLLAVGAGLAPTAIATTGRPVLIASAAKLLGVPTAAAVLALLAGLEPAAAGVAVLYAALPCSASSYVLARQMGGDAPMMANTITLQTLAAVLTLPLVIAAALALFTPAG